jgi:hypothetical protein
MQLNEYNKDDKLFLEMLANGSKRNNTLVNQPPKIDVNIESMRNIYKVFETLALQEDFIISNFSEFLIFLERYLKKSVFDFKKHINQKQD